MSYSPAPDHNRVGLLATVVVIAAVIFLDAPTRAEAQPDSEQAQQLAREAEQLAAELLGRSLRRQSVPKRTLVKDLTKRLVAAAPLIPAIARATKTQTSRPDCRRQSQRLRSWLKKWQSRITSYSWPPGGSPVVTSRVPTMQWLGTRVHAGMPAPLLLRAGLGNEQLEKIYRQHDIALMNARSNWTITHPSQKGPLWTSDPWHVVVNADVKWAEVARFVAFLRDKGHRRVVFVFSTASRMPPPPRSALDNIIARHRASLARAHDLVFLPCPAAAGFLASMAGMDFFDRAMAIRDKLPGLVQRCRCAVAGGVDGLIATIAAFWPPFGKPPALGLKLRIRGKRLRKIQAPGSALFQKAHRKIVARHRKCWTCAYSIVVEKD